MQSDTGRLRFGAGLVLMLALSFFLLGACSLTDEDKDKADGDDEQEITPIEDGDTTPSVERVFDGPAGSAIRLSGLGEYRLVAYWPVSQDGNTGFTVKGAPSAKKALSTHLIERDPALAARWQERLALDERLRRSESESVRLGYAAEMKRVLEQREARPALFACEAGKVERGGSCVDEFALKFSASSPAKNITVKVKGIGTSCVIAVDKDDLASVSDADVQALLTKFDTIIVPRDHALFGSPLIGGTDYADADADGKRLIVFSHLVADLKAVGFFYNQDFLKTGGNGNVSDLLWVVPPSADNPLDSIYGTLAHEYLHLLEYGVKTVRYNVEEERFLAESLAHLAEDATGFGIDNVDATWSYLSAADKTSWAFSDDTVETRGMGFLMMRYWFEQKGGVGYSKTEATLSDKGGAAFLKAIVQSNKAGFAAVEAALGGKVADRFLGFLGAVSLNGLNLANTGSYTYAPLYSDPLTGQSVGVCTHCTRKNAAGQDQDFTGFSTEALSGDYDGTVQATGLVSLSITVQAPLNLQTQADDAALRFAVIKVN